MSYIDRFPEARGLELLTDEEEKVLAEKAKEGDAAAKQKLINHSVRYAISLGITRSRNANRVDLQDDIVAAAMTGLCEAAETYDGSSRFASWATRPIQWAMDDALHAIGGDMMIPKNAMRLFNRVRKIVLEDPGIVADDDAPQKIREILGTRSKDSDIMACINVLGKWFSSIDAEDDTGRQFEELAANPNAPPTDAEANDKSRNDYINKTVEGALEHIGRPYSEVIRRKNINGETTREIKESFGVTTQRISQIHIKGLAMMHDYLCERMTHEEIKELFND